MDGNDDGGTEVITRKSPFTLVCRFRTYRDWPRQVIRSCEKFKNKFSRYPTRLVLAQGTMDRICAESDRDPSIQQVTKEQPLTQVLEGEDGSRMTVELHPEADYHPEGEVVDFSDCRTMYDFFMRAAALKHRSLTGYLRDEYPEWSDEQLAEFIMASQCLEARDIEKAVLGKDFFSLSQNDEGTFIFKCCDCTLELVGALMEDSYYVLRLGGSPSGDGEPLPLELGGEVELRKAV